MTMEVSTETAAPVVAAPPQNDEICGDNKKPALLAENSMETELESKKELASRLATSVAVTVVPPEDHTSEHHNNNQHQPQTNTTEASNTTTTAAVVTTNSTSTAVTESANGKQGSNGPTTAKTNGGMRYSRIFKKVSQDGNLVLFLPQRELMVTETRVEALMGVALIHENVMKTKDIKVYLQVVLVFRYGREDEELMGLRFCNEVVVAAEQIHPTAMEVALTSTSSSTNAPAPLVNGQGFIAVPFVVDMGATAPPSVRLVPCRPYTGSPIGTSYEVQLFASHAPDELPRRRKMVQMSLRVYERIPKELPPKPHVVLHKQFVFSDKPLVVMAKLDNGVYAEGDTIRVNLSVNRNDGGGGHGVRKVKVTAVQQVGVAMFSTGNFKNNVGTADQLRPQPDPRDDEMKAELSLKLELGKDYAWAAMDETSKKDAELVHLAPTVTHANKALFVVRVTYFVHVVLLFGLLKRPISLKLPFLLRRSVVDKKKKESTKDVEPKEDEKEKT